MCCENEGVSTKEMIKVQSLIRDNIYTLLEVRERSLSNEINESCDNGILSAVRSLVVGVACDCEDDFCG